MTTSPGQKGRRASLSAISTAEYGESLGNMRTAAGRYHSKARATNALIDLPMSNRELSLRSRLLYVCGYEPPRDRF
eukprot:scaffold405337_cov27-Prasinocladus_malaysianus.AAC.2